MFKYKTPLLEYPQTSHLELLDVYDVYKYMLYSICINIMSIHPTGVICLLNDRITCITLAYTLRQALLSEVDAQQK